MEHHVRAGDRRSQWGYVLQVVVDDGQFDGHPGGAVRARS